MRTRLLMVLTTAGLVLGLAPAGRAQDGEVKALLDRAIKALGGAERIEKYQAGRVKSKGRLELSGGIEMTQDIAYQLPDKFRQEMGMTVNGKAITVVTVYDGKQGAVLVDGKKLPADAKITEALKDGLYQMQVGRLLMLKDKGIEVSAVGEAQVNGKPAVGVRVVKKGEPDVNLYFDKQTALPVKVETRAHDFMTGQEVTEERIITEYQQVDGLPAAKKIEVNRDGKRFLDAEVTEVKFLERIDDSEFAIP